jgi:transposase
MATLDRTSVREQFSGIKDNLDRLSSEGKVSDEVQSLIASLLTLMELMLSIFLEKRTPKNSRNSSIPSSQSGHDDTQTNQSRGSKKKSYQEGVVDNLRSVETVTVIPLEQCPICGEQLHDTPYSKRERRTKIDIVFEKVTEHVEVEVKECPANTVKENFPADMPGPRQYGHGVIAFIINLLTTQMVALRRAQQLLSDLIGEVISEDARIYSSLASCAGRPWRNDNC